ncbi:hypothetical protein [Celeribacter ethanolicus]|uniref:hypothetical protein n=1 Tax=Celeribacter ethanolicus TaxID=1758178 RepID=UPI000830F79A
MDALRAKLGEFSEVLGDGGEKEFVLCAVRSSKPEPREVDLSLCETASYLKLNVVAVRRLRDGGYLTQIRRRNPDTNFQRFYITKASIKRFEALYITLGQMADLENVAAIHLARRLDWEGIPTISCTSGYVRAYERGKVC